MSVGIVRETGRCLADAIVSEDIGCEPVIPSEIALAHIAECAFLKRIMLIFRTFCNDFRRLAGFRALSHASARLIYYWTPCNVAMDVGETLREDAMIEQIEF
jgi:hypothetical protein